MRKSLYLFFVFLFLQSVCVYTQTFTTLGGSISDNKDTTFFPIDITGLPTIIDSTFGFDSVSINIIHSYDKQLELFLRAPDGTTVLLVANVGDDGDDFINTSFSNRSPFFNIVYGFPPFTGMFTPQGVFGRFNNGQDPNGQWNLLILDNDTLGNETGFVVNWSIAFSNTPATPIKFFSSNLPIVKISTGGKKIVDDPKIIANMSIIYNGQGQRNYVNNPANHYTGKIGIELRGSGSQAMPKKGYAFETQDPLLNPNDVSLLGMPAEHDWFLLPMWDDETLMKDAITYELYRRMGWYASRTKYCILLVDGEYKGVYMLGEKIKRDKDRIDINKLTKTDNLGNLITGGYIFKLDRGSITGTDFWYSKIDPPQNSNGQKIIFYYEYPDTDSITWQQKNYLQTYVDSFETALLNGNLYDAVNGYRKHIDIKSFVDYFLISEFSNNYDAYRLSTFMYKQRITNGGKLFMGPPWDYNIAYNHMYKTGWSYKISMDNPLEYHQIPFWWQRLLQDSLFTNQLQCRWKQLRNTTLLAENIDHLIDSLNTLLHESRRMNFSAWPQDSGFGGAVSGLKEWIHDRINWLDDSLPGNCLYTSLEKMERDEDGIMLYPNPFSDKLFLLNSGQKETQVQISLLNAVGEIVREQKMNLYPGDNTYDIDQRISRGIYYLKIKTGTKTYIKKACKIN